MARWPASRIRRQCECAPFFSLVALLVVARATAGPDEIAKRQEQLENETEQCKDETEEGKEVLIADNALAKALPILDEPPLNPSVHPTSLSKTWWHKDGGLKLKSPHVLNIHTMNFNETVTNPKHPRVLIAFYDPRSESFKDLRKELDSIADHLAKVKHSDNGRSLGHLGACDVTVQNYLAEQEAPEMHTGWQQSKDQFMSGFKFGRPRFFPLILVLYRHGKRIEEYTGVVSSRHVLHYLRLQKRKVGGSDIIDTQQLRKFLKGPGPIALSCGVANGTMEYDVFNQTAHKLHGKLAFAIAPLDTCAEVLAMELAEPQVVLTRGDGAALAGSYNIQLANASNKANSTLLSEWLGSFKSEVLEEMSPDNSHMFLADDSPPLALLLVDARDALGRANAEAVFQPIEKKLRNDFNLVWSDCRSFGSQFDAAHDCPVVVVVEPRSLDFEKKTMKEITSGDGSPSVRLATWMRKTRAYDFHLKIKNAKHELARKLEEADAKRGKEQRIQSNHTNNPTKVAEEDDKPDTGPYEDHLSQEVASSLGHLMSGNRLVSNNSEMAALGKTYLHVLECLNELRQSYEAKYSHLPFDFSEFEKMQGLHHALRLLVTSREDVLAKVRNITRLTWLWGAIEQRAAFTEELRKVNFSEPKLPKEIRRLSRKLVTGIQTMIHVFHRLFKFLDKHAREASLGVPMTTPLNIERRAASNLSVREFIERYARPGIPVLITGLNLTEEEPWTLDFFHRRCFNKTARLMEHVEHSRTWGRLKGAAEIPLHEFIDSFTTNETRQNWYLHDWSLPANCPEVFGPPPFRSFTVPKYFAGDYFQRAGFAGYRHSWPSLFIGSEKTVSKMHIDSGNTHFWLHLFSGTKEWRFYPRTELVNLYRAVRSSHFWFDVFNPDPDRFPLTEYAQMYTGIQKPGELIFMPAGNPHAVRNLEPIHAISMNYVDDSNIDLYLLDRIIHEDWSLVEMLTDGNSFPHGLSSEQKHLRFGEWKSVSWRHLNYDISNFKLENAVPARGTRAQPSSSWRI